MTTSQPTSNMRRNFVTFLPTILLAILLVAGIAVAAVFLARSPGAAAWSITRQICPSDRIPSQLEQELRAALNDPVDDPLKLSFSQTPNGFLTDEGCPEEMGGWIMLPMPEESDRMQAVHATLLPNGKVLLVNGSSNRNRAEPRPDLDPTAPLAADQILINGVVYQMEDGIRASEINNDDELVGNDAAVDNTSLFDLKFADPLNGSFDRNVSPFKKISSPPAVANGEPNDIFCAGHLQLPNGDVLFVGGTRRYYQGVRFQGAKQANFFDWETETWGEPELLEDGHWYPTLVPLEDGAIAAFSGLSASTTENVSPIVEIYIPETGEWQHIDITDLPNSPFNRPMNDETGITDLIDLYPRIFPTKDGRFLITGDGGGKTPLVIHKSTNTYFARFDKDEATGKYSLSFEPGPDRLATSKVYGTAAMDPSSENGDVLLYGGIIGTNDISFGPGKYAIRGASIVSSVERWIAPRLPSASGEWKLDDTFLARVDEDIIQQSAGSYTDPAYTYTARSTDLGRFGNRAMDVAVILPTKQTLLLNGGNYAEHQPNLHPLLITPNPDKDPTDPADHLGFYTKILNPDNQPRLYHNTAVLLPDARVLVMGGNNSRAVRFTDSGDVDLNITNDFTFTPKGYVANTAEIYQQAIYYPPYLFGPSERPEIATEIDELHYGETVSISITNASGDGTEDSVVLIKLASMTHSFDSGQRFLELDRSYTDDGEIEVTAPTNAHFSPPGYYMLFYVNADGKPSEAKIVQLS